jgi:hypothetical protein
MVVVVVVVNTKYHFSPTCAYIDLRVVYLKALNLPRIKGVRVVHNFLSSNRNIGPRSRAWESNILELSVDMVDYYLALLCR